MNTMQQEFDAVVAHLYKQGEPALTEDGTCSYRGRDGTMCAVGCRIPDASYVTSMEGNQLDEVIDHFGDNLPTEIVAYRGFFNRLQEIHDGWSFRRHHERMSWVEWLDEQLPGAAVDFNLTFTKPVA